MSLMRGVSSFGLDFVMALVEPHFCVKPDRTSSLDSDTTVVQYDDALDGKSHSSL